MSVFVTVEVGGKRVAKLCVSNRRMDSSEPEQYPYGYELTAPGKPRVRGELVHDYDDGIYVLIRDVLTDLLLRRPSLSKGPKHRNRVQCPVCKDILESIWGHDYRVCSCGETMTDGGRSQVHNARGGRAAPPDGKIERLLKRLGRNGEVQVRWTAKDGFSLYCRAGTNKLSKQLPKTQYLKGPSLLQLLEEAEKRDKRGK